MKNSALEELLINSIDWDNISKKDNLSYNFIIKYKKYINWYSIINNRHYNEKIIARCIDCIPLCTLITSRKLSEEFIEKYIVTTDKHWEGISCYQILSESFMDKYKDKLNWDMMIVSQAMSEEFIISHIDYINWKLLSTYKRKQLSVDFLLKYQDKLDWNEISALSSYFTDETLYKIGDLINWNVYNYRHPYIKEKIIEKYIQKFDIEILLEENELSEEFLIKHQDYLGWDNISRYAKINREFIIKYKYFINWKLLYFNRRTSFTNNEFYKLKPNPIVYHIKNFIRKHA